jgi:UDP:flavonoid glycosyltransferase YjiC (YdhE family)
MKILYGVQSDGMGHALRSYAVMKYLISQGHTVKVVTSGRVLDFFQQHDIDVQEVE